MVRELQLPTKWACDVPGNLLVHQFSRTTCRNLGVPFVFQLSEAVFFSLHQFCSGHKKQTTGLDPCEQQLLALHAANAAAVGQRAHRQYSRITTAAAYFCAAMQSACQGAIQGSKPDWHLANWLDNGHQKTPNPVPQVGMLITHRTSTIEVIPLVTLDKSCSNRVTADNALLC